MARGNGPTERHLAELAEPHRGHSIVVIGPGPGIGMEAAASTGARRVVGVDPSPVMRAACRRRCAPLTDRVDFEFVDGTAAHTGQPDAAADVVISVNNLFIWPDRAAGLHEIYRILRPGGCLLVSTHNKWLPGGRDALAANVQDAGFTDVTTWAWEPPGPGATQAAQLRAVRP